MSTPPISGGLSVVSSPLSLVAGPGLSQSAVFAWNHQPKTNEKNMKDQELLQIFRLHAFRETAGLERQRFEVTDQIHLRLRRNLGFHRQAPVAGVDDQSASPLPQ